MEIKLEQEFVPNFMQVGALKALNKTTDKAGIVVMPTGTGKTFLAALWFRDKLKIEPESKLLFVCHNRDILSQANEKEFQRCLSEFGITFGYYTGRNKETAQCLFATVQCLNRNLKMIKSDEFDYVIVDEAHHYQAKSFKRVIGHFKPKFKL